MTVPTSRLLPLHCYHTRFLTREHEVRVYMADAFLPLASFLTFTEDICCSYDLCIVYLTSFLSSPVELVFEFIAQIQKSRLSPRG